MESPLDVSNSRFQTLPERPPTPPLEKGHEPEPAEQAGAGLLPLPVRDPRLSLQTPPNLHSPDSCADSAASGQRRLRKRVGFSAQPEYKEHSDAWTAVPTPPSALSSVSSKPVKSILKPSPPTSAQQDFSLGGVNATSPITPQNFAAMLDSVLTNLARGDRDLKADAYMMMVRSLKASDNLPDRIALQNKMGSFMQYIQRDITPVLQGDGADLSIVKHAFTLLSTFLRFPSIASTVLNDAAASIVDHCIRMLEDPSVPKDLCRHVMLVLTLQDFSPKVINHDRLGKLLSALHRVDEHVKGKGVIMARLHTYRKLLKQCRSQMPTHVDWLHDLLTDMLSGMKEIRAEAIKTGLEAAYSFRKDKSLARQTAKRLAEVFDLEYGEEKYFDFFMTRLNSMRQTNDREDNHHVPQVWGVVTLLLPSPARNWNKFGVWLKLIQDCFNRSDPQTKYEANYAWSRYASTFVDNANGFSEKDLHTLMQPFLSQIKRRGGKQLEELHRIVLGSICNLFYFALRPGINPADIDSAWNGAVAPLLKQMILDRRPEESLDTQREAAFILISLFDTTRQRLWSANQTERSTLIKPQELPSVDSKWIRRNAAKVFPLVEPILEANFAKLHRRDSEVYALWKYLVTSVASAASKEVKVSVDTNIFIAESLGALFKIWSAGTTQPAEEDKENPPSFLLSVREYLLVMLDSLSTLPFTEKLLTRDSSNKFHAVSAKPVNKNMSAAMSPLHHLFSILTALPPGVGDDEKYADFIQAVFSPFLTAKSGRARAELAHDLLQLLPADAPCPYGAWLLVAGTTMTSLEGSRSSSHSSSPLSETPVGHELREVVKVLERGLLSTPKLPCNNWNTLFHALVGMVTDELGHAGRALCVTEPLSKAMLDHSAGRKEKSLSEMQLFGCIELVSTAVYPHDRSAIESARRRLWGTSIAGSRSGSPDPFDHFYKLLDWVLRSCYQHFHQYGAEMVAQLFDEVSKLLARCPLRLAATLIVGIQDGMSFWVKDELAMVNSRQVAEVAETVKLVWDRTCDVLSELLRSEDFRLQSVEKLLCAAFESKHKHVVNTAALAWNRVFDGVDEINYPETLKGVLLGIQPFVDIVLPGLESSSHGSGAQRHSFLDTQDDLDVVNILSSKSARTPRPISSSRQSVTPGSKLFGLAAPRARDTTPKSSPRQAKQPRQTARLRHDDSQIHFEPIQSSPPAPAAVESQLLTERQKEIRERQIETAVLFSDVSMSPGTQLRLEDGRRKEPMAENLLPDEGHAATPEPEGVFDEYISSTPTPRRGQTMAIITMSDNDPELADIPSSPPEPRRNPLLSEIQSRSTSSILHQWDLSSSPVSGSPIPSHQRAGPDQELRASDADLVVSRDEVSVDMAPSHDSLADEMDVDEENNAAAPQPGPGQPTVQTRASKPWETPSRNKTRPSQAAVTETPVSTHDVFVDALASPQKSLSLSNSAAIAAAEQKVAAPAAPVDESFDISDVDETSMLRVMAEAEAEAQNKLGQPGIADNEEEELESSPEPEPEQGQVILDCITVRALGDSLSEGEEESEAPPRAVETLHERLASPAEADVVPKTPASRNKKRRRTVDSFAIKGRKKTRRSAAMKAERALSSQPSDATSQEDMEQEEGEHSILGSSQEDSYSQEPEVEAVASRRRSVSSIGSAQPSPAKEVTAVEEPQIAALEVPQELQAGEEEAQPLEMAAGEAMDAADEAEENVPAASEIPNIDIAAPISKVEQLRNLLRGGMEVLQSATLSREEVYEMEDLFMDMKRELYEAERRGRL